MIVGAFGLGTQSTQNYDRDKGGFSWMASGNSFNPEPVYGYGHIHNAISPTYNVGIAIRYAAFPRVFFQSTQGETKSWAEAYTTGNTTKASDGTLKAASPVARIVNSQEECQRSDIDEPGFEWCGCGTANAEAEGINVLRQDTGVYLLSGAAGLASEGWQLLAPMDPGGMGELGVVEAEQTDGDNIIIRLYTRKYILSDEGEIVKTKGEPIDVPTNSWIDVRLDMPEDSVFNRKSFYISQN